MPHRKKKSSPPAAYLDIIDTAIAIAGADFGNLQLCDPATQELKIVAQRGFPDFFLHFWEHVSDGNGTCGNALGQQSRVIVEDVLDSPIFADPKVRAIMLRAGVRSCQSTPIVDRSGALLGIFSTHKKEPSYPSLITLRTLDLLAKIAADAIVLARTQD